MVRAWHVLHRRKRCLATEQALYLCSTTLKHHTSAAQSQSLSRAERHFIVPILLLTLCPFILVISALRLLARKT